MFNTVDVFDMIGAGKEHIRIKSVRFIYEGESTCKFVLMRNLTPQLWNCLISTTKSVTMQLFYSFQVRLSTFKSLNAAMPQRRLLTVNSFVPNCMGLRLRSWFITPITHCPNFVLPLHESVLQVNVFYSVRRPENIPGYDIQWRVTVVDQDKSIIVPTAVQWSARIFPRQIACEENMSSNLCTVNATESEVHDRPVRLPSLLQIHTFRKGVSVDETQFPRKDPGSSTLPGIKFSAVFYLYFPRNWKSN